MRTRQRLLALKKWAYETLCQGRSMKAPASDGDITEFRTKEPQVYLGWWPAMQEQPGVMMIDPTKSCPGILIAPGVSDAKNMEEKRFDNYRNVHRPQELGQSLNVSILFSVYEPGIRLPGFVTEEKEIDMSKFLEGTEEGLFTLTDWMDECKDALIAQKFIPESDLFVDEISVTYGPYMDQNFIVDKRPLYYGFINAKFQCYSEGKNNSSLNKFLI